MGRLGADVPRKEIRDLAVILILSNQRTEREFRESVFPLPLYRSPAERYGFGQFHCEQPGQLDPNCVLSANEQAADPIAHKYLLPFSLEWLYSLGDMSPMGYTPRKSLCSKTPKDEGSISSSRSIAIRCDARASGNFNTLTKSAVITIAHELLRDGYVQMWEVVLVRAEQGNDGLLKTRIFLCHPEWDEPFEVASIESSRDSVKVGLSQRESHPP